MKDIKNIIANNLITLRKKNNLTQNDLAEKLNYSDNAISRWEHAEVTPNIETLQQISEIFNVPLRSLIEDNALREADVNEKRQAISNLAKILIGASLVWLIATIIFATSQLLLDHAIWQVYIWALPIMCLVMLPFHHYWGRHIYKFIMLSIFLWTLILAIFLQFFTLTPWMWLIFTIGIPIQVALAIWAFVKPKPKKPLTQAQIEKKEKLKTLKENKKEKKIENKTNKHAIKQEKKQAKLSAKKEKKRDS